MPIHIKKSDGSSVQQGQDYSGQSRTVQNTIGENQTKGYDDWISRIRRGRTTQGHAKTNERQGKGKSEGYKKDLMIGHLENKGKEQEEWTDGQSVVKEK